MLDRANLLPHASEINLMHVGKKKNFKKVRVDGMNVVRKSSLCLVFHLFSEALMLFSLRKEEKKVMFKAVRCLKDFLFVRYGSSFCSV